MINCASLYLRSYKWSENQIDKTVFHSVERVCWVWYKDIHSTTMHLMVQPITTLINEEHILSGPSTHSSGTQPKDMRVFLSFSPGLLVFHLSRGQLAQGALHTCWKKTSTSIDFRTIFMARANRDNEIVQLAQLLFSRRCLSDVNVPEDTWCNGPCLRDEICSGRIPPVLPNHPDSLTLMN